MNKNLTQEFEDALRGLYHTIVAETKYRPTLLMKMINEEGALATAKNLINKDTYSDGYTKLWELNRLDLTVEAFVLANHQWYPLFTELELTKATTRLKKFQK